MSDPDPPRARGLWWKVPLALFAALLLIALVAHAVWTARERAAVAQRVAAIRALGEPIDVADLAEPEVPDDQNAAVAIRAAAAAFVEPDDRKDRRRQMEGDDPRAFELPLTPEESAMLRESIDDNATTLAALDDASHRPGIAWNDVSPGTPRLVQLFPEASHVRQLANLLNDAASLGGQDGRGAATVLAPLATIDALTQPVAARRSLVSSLVAVGMQAMSASTTIAVAPRLSLDATADREAARRRIAQVLDDSSIERMWRAGLLGERVDAHEAIASIRNGTMAPIGKTSPTPSRAQPIGAYLMSPLFDGADSMLLDYLGAAITTLDAPDLSEWRTRATAMQQIKRDVDASKLLIMAEVLMASLDRAFETRYRVVTTRHLAAVALASQLYAVDHAGALPPSLDALVPAYLPRVPSDAIDGRPLRYDAARAIAWSVGANDTDERDDETVKSPNYAGDLWQMKDAVIHLTPTTRPATQPGE